MTTLIQLGLQICFAFFPFHLEFNTRVQESKKEAEEEIKNIPDIESEIENAENKTLEAIESLSDAEKNSLMAAEIAEKTRDIMTSFVQVGCFATSQQNIHLRNIAIVSFILH